MDLTRLVRGPRALPRWAIATLVANIGIVVTGGLVRLTGSGLGCPTWPRCTDESFVAHPELGIYGAIEFGNRLLTFVLILIAVLTFASAVLYRDPDRRERDGRRRDLFWLTGGLALGIPAQGVVGGITVLTDLNPYLVGLHLLLSMVLISLAVWLVRLTRGHVARPVSDVQVALPRLTLAALWIVVAVGTVLTGSGPHAGDAAVPRNGLDPVVLTTVHSAAVFAAVAGTVACALWLRSRAALLLLAVEGLQAGIGISQYYLGLPIGLVLLHLLGAALAIAAGTNLMLSVRGPRRSVEPAAAGQAVGAERVPLRG
jgi:cytochrome c oxidase assembly protein subunit 15